MAAALRHHEPGHPADNGARISRLRYLALCAVARHYGATRPTESEFSRFSAWETGLIGAWKAILRSRGSVAIVATGSVVRRRERRSVPAWRVRAWEVAAAMGRIIAGWLRRLLVRLRLVREKK